MGTESKISLGIHTELSIKLHRIIIPFTKEPIGEKTGFAEGIIKLLVPVYVYVLNELPYIVIGFEFKIVG